MYIIQLIITTLMPIKAPELIHLPARSLYPLAKISPFFPPPRPWQPPFYSLFCAQLFSIPHTCEIIQHLSFSVWLISLSTIPSKSHPHRCKRQEWFIWVWDALHKVSGHEFSAEMERDKFHPKGIIFLQQIRGDAGLLCYWSGAESLTERLTHLQPLVVRKGVQLWNHYRRGCTNSGWQLDPVLLWNRQNLLPADCFGDLHPATWVFTPRKLLVAMDAQTRLL